jgi:hypothetical protein
MGTGSARVVVARPTRHAYLAPPLTTESQIGRAVGSAVAGYIAMFLTVFLLMKLGWTALGAGGSFKPGSWETSTGWW